MAKSKINSFLKVTVGTAVIAGTFSLALSTLPGFSQASSDTDLTITGGVLTTYAPDQTDNDDICTPGDDSTTVEGVSCDATERAISFGSLTTLSSRQNATSTADDWLLEDLRGLTSTNLTYACTVSDLSDGGSLAITLGSNGGGEDSGTNTGEVDAPGGVGDEEKLFATLDPSAGTLSVLKPTTLSASVSNYTEGSKTTVIDTTTSVTVYSATSTPSARAEIDGVALKYRVPAYVEAASYAGTLTCTASSI